MKIIIFQRQHKTEKMIFNRKYISGKGRGNGREGGHWDSGGGKWWKVLCMKPNVNSIVNHGDCTYAMIITVNKSTKKNGKKSSQILSVVIFGLWLLLFLSSSFVLATIYIVKKLFLKKNVVMFHF